jgi:osmotically-inducible protein OsmY
MRTFLLATSVVAVLAVAALYAATELPDRRIVEPTEDLRDTSRSLAAKEALIEHFGGDAVDIHVVVDENAASISGEIAERSTLELSEEVVKVTGGVIVVHNFLDYTPTELYSVGDLATPDELQTRDAALEEKVVSELTSQVGDDAVTVAVEACDGVVILRGSLPDARRREIIVRTAQGLPEVVRVIDLLEVTS